MPTLILIGDRDTIAGREIAETLSGGIAQSRLVVIPDAGHLINLAQPKLFNRLVLEFLAQLRLVAD